MARRFLAILAAMALLLSGCAPWGMPTREKAPQLTVYCFRAGKADAFLFMGGEGNVLIDTGEDGFGEEILSCLAHYGVSSLDYLILTHFDRDHVGGAAELLEGCAVGYVLQSNSPKDSKEYENYCNALEKTSLTPVTVRERFTFSLGGIDYTVLPPEQSDYAEKASNNSSLIVEVCCGTQRMVFAGDAEEERLGEYLRTGPSPCALLKVPYHGHWQSSLPTLITALSPQFAVITSSQKEPEDSETSTLLAEKSVQVFFTRVAPVIVCCRNGFLTVEYDS